MSQGSNWWWRRVPSSLPPSCSSYLFSFFRCPECCPCLSGGPAAPQGAGQYPDLDCPVLSASQVPQSVQGRPWEAVWSGTRPGWGAACGRVLFHSSLSVANPSTSPGCTCEMWPQMTPSPKAPTAHALHFLARPAFFPTIVHNDRRIRLTGLSLKW